MAIGEDVYCTLVLSDSYLPGAAVLAHSLRDTGTTRKLACLITQDSLRASTITELQSLYNYVIPIERIGNPSPANLYLMGRPDLLYTFTKIHLWRMTQFRKIVYIDSDVVALRAPDELFDVTEGFAAAPDVGWPDIFNTGVMVIAPNMGEYHALRSMASAGDSFDGADQGLLNQYYEHRPWRRLNFTYNCTPSANYQYEPAYRYFKRDISLVHFIGGDKPWQQERWTKGVSGAFQELLGRWWAVYDRHFSVSTYEYTATGRRQAVQHRAVQEQVRQETQPAYYATGYPVESTQPAPAPSYEAPPMVTEVPMTEPAQPVAEALDQGHIEPTPTVHQRKFSAPQMEWDATRAAPPVDAKPEAANFPTQLYEFSQDTQPFKPPVSYPEPPRDMWYEVPKSKPKPLPAIFPWEERVREEKVRPTRVFLDEVPEKTPELEKEEEDDFRGGDELEVRADEDGRAFEPKTPTIQINDDTPWGAFGTVNKNAWDEVAGIEEYVRALTAFQKNRGNLQVLQHQQPGAQQQQPTTSKADQQHVLSPDNEPEPAEILEKVRERRESLILTDFPSAVERPSLPVTPAPRRRASYWDKDEAEEAELGLPAAEGVPDQADWVCPQCGFFLPPSRLPTAM
ncbi:glycosyltransferase family 8 protein [Baudoinia panamericana UAMH 10762]|uniref:glycogenin glucosyltransferase n=1 Tax=Baudoinia panamericana (strain UAMH 10762) TaxID=717646 RepID=M2MUH2_BAUPA|nr:glycosyltransferase family 8 protein [Baudoinia panamericana UAMH 10762]EMD00567.1 glycosyltransferase family 8 protein [Baudoinia panamericana UAMH 10762]